MFMKKLSLIVMALVMTFLVVVPTVAASDRMGEMLGIAVQVTAGTTAESTSTSLRLISSVDKLEYSAVGFEIVLKDQNGNPLTAEPIVQTSETVYQSITSYGKTVTNYKPNEVFADESRYFFTLKITDIPQVNFGMTVIVRAFTVELDGMTHTYGTEKSFKLSDCFMDALDPPQIEILSSGVAARVTDSNDPFKYLAWPTVTQDENGKLYMVASKRLQHVDPFGAVMLYTSEDGGTTWSVGKTLIDTPWDDRDPSIVYLGNGRLMVTFYYHKLSKYTDSTDEEYYKWTTNNTVSYEMIQNKLDELNTYKGTVSAGAYVLYSNDYGVTWGLDQSNQTVTDTANMTKVKFSEPHGGGVIHTMVGDLKAGTLFYVSDECYSDLQGIVFMTSTDGFAWTKSATVCERQIEGANIYETHAIQLETGRLVVSLRVKLNGVLKTYITYSDDGGKNWSTAAYVTDGAPAHFLEHSSGALIMTYSDRVTPTGIRARVSYDGGATWSEEMEIAGQPSAHATDLGYPCSTELSDGSIMTVYYYHYTSTGGTIDENPSILYTKWKLTEGES